MIARRRPVALAACALLAGCAGGSETGNPAVPTPIGLLVRSSDPTAVAVSNGADSTVIDQAWVAFGSPAFLAPGECELLESFPHLGPTALVADLAAPDVSLEVELRPAPYCGVVVPLEHRSESLPAGAPGELADHSIVVRGTRSDGVSFLLAFPEQDELELQALALSGTFDVRPDSSLLLAFDVATWLRDVDLLAAELTADGTIRIDATHNTPLLLQFEANIDCSLELFEDGNADGTLDRGDRRIARCPQN